MPNGNKGASKINRRRNGRGQRKGKREGNAKILANDEVQERNQDSEHKRDGRSTVLIKRGWKDVPKFEKVQVYERKRTSQLMCHLEWATTDIAGQICYGEQPARTMIECNDRINGVEIENEETFQGRGKRIRCQLLRMSARGKRDGLSNTPYVLIVFSEVSKQVGRKFILSEKHTTATINFIDVNPSVFIVEVNEHLLKRFNYLKFLREANFSDKVVFDINMKRSKDWYRKCMRVTVTKPTTGTNITSIFEAISAAGLITADVKKTETWEEEEDRGIHKFGDNNRTLDKLLKNGSR
ncbi:hypothetical protein F4703DRAFT_1956676 [Phycomyces blakesleeanus]